LAKATAKAGMGPGGSPPLKGQPESDDPEARTWWLDVLSPTDEEMRMLAKVSVWRRCRRRPDRVVDIEPTCHRSLAFIP